MKVDKDEKTISWEKPSVLAKIREMMFILVLTLRSWCEKEAKRRKIRQKNDIALAINSAEAFNFLFEIVNRKYRKDQLQTPNSNRDNACYGPLDLIFLAICHRLKSASLKRTKSVYLKQPPMTIPVTEPAPQYATRRKVIRKSTTETMPVMGPSDDLPYQYTPQSNPGMILGKRSMDQQIHFQASSCKMAVMVPSDIDPYVQ